MNDEQIKMIHWLGNELAKHLPGFFGNIRINVQNGVYVSSNIEQSLKSETKTLKQ